MVRKIKALGRLWPYSARRGAVGAPEIFGDTAFVERRPKLAFSYRPFSLVPPRVIATGSSTGGPQVLVNMLGALSPALSRVPVLIAQHMPPVFTAILAERLTKATGREAKEAENGEPVKPGTIYVAPGGHHMTVLRPASLTYRQRAAGAFLPAGRRMPSAAASVGACAALLPHQGIAEAASKLVRGMRP